MSNFYPVQISKALIAIFVVLVLTGCSTTKYLGPRETFLSKNKVTIDKSTKIKNTRNLKWDLETLYKQKPNKNFLWAKRRYFHYKNGVLPDPSDAKAVKKYNKKWSRFARKNLAERPAIYKEALAENTARSMEFYLNNKGYYYAEVDFESKTKGNYTDVTYIVKPKEQYTIDSVFFSSDDPNAANFLDSTEHETFLKHGMPVSDEIFNNEFKRIIDGMNNAGYAFFEKNFIKSYGDSSDLKVDVFINVLPPNDAFQHKIYKVGKVTINPDYRAYVPDSLLRDTIINGYHFKLGRNGLPVKAKTLLKSIHIHPGEFYNKYENLERTKVSLRLLEPYKSEVVRMEVDSLQDDQLNFLILLTLDEKMELSGGIEANFSNFSQNTGPDLLIGTAASTNFRNKNAFKNATVFEANISAGFDLNFNTLFRNQTEPLIFAREFTVGTNFYLPKFMDYLSLAKRLNKIKVDEDENGNPEKLISDRFYRDLGDRARTRISLLYDAVNIVDFYAYQTFNATLGFDLQRDQRNFYSVNQIGVNYFLPESFAGFDTIAANNPFIARSFTPQLFTGLFFRDFRYIYNGPQNTRGAKWYASAQVELSGAEVWLTNWLYNTFSSTPQTFELGLQNGDIVSFSQYIRFAFEGRYNKITTSSSSIAFRGFGGVIFPYGFSKGGEIPYVKQFFGGGPNGIRGWRARELGPGGFEDPLASTVNAFYQTGDLHLELNAEYRFDIPILESLKGAFFVDMGNVWTLQRDINRPNSRFRLFKEVDQQGTVINESFVNHIAVAAGGGIRIDFSFAVIRFDIGVKVRNPISDSTGKHWFKDPVTFRTLNYNLALGYPF